MKPFLTVLVVVLLVLGVLAGCASGPNPYIIDVDVVPKGFYGIPIVAHAGKYSF